MHSQVCAPPHHAGHELPPPEPQAVPPLRLLVCSGQEEQARGVVGQVLQLLHGAQVGPGARHTLCLIFAGWQITHTKNLALCADAAKPTWRLVTMGSEPCPHLHDVANPSCWRLGKHAPPCPLPVSLWHKQPSPLAGVTS